MINKSNYMNIPEEYELIDFFGVLPNDKNNDGFLSFKIESNKVDNLYFSYDIFEKSVQTTLKKNDKTIFSVCFECSEKIEVVTLANGRKCLCVSFCLPDGIKAELRIEQVESFFACFWSLLEI